MPSPVVLELRWKILTIQLDNQDCGAEWMLPDSDTQNRLSYVVMFEKGSWH